MSNVGFSIYEATLRSPLVALAPDMQVSAWVPSLTKLLFVISRGLLSATAAFNSSQKMKLVSESLVKHSVYDLVMPRVDTPFIFCV